MSKKILVPLLAVTIRRDANTIPVVTVPRHEVATLRRIFGKENVTEGEAVGTVELDAELEQERLSNKYGAEVIVAVYGDDNGERLAELIEKSKVSTAKDKKAEKGQAESGGQEAGGKAK